MAAKSSGALLLLREFSAKYDVIEIVAKNLDQLVCVERSAALTNGIGSLLWGVKVFWPETGLAVAKPEASFGRLLGSKIEPAQIDMPKLPRSQPRQIRRSYCSHDVDFISMLLDSLPCSYLRRPPPPPLRAPPPPRDPMLEEPRLLLARALDPLKPLVPPSEGVPVSASAARHIAAANIVRSARASAIAGSANPACSTDAPRPQRRQPPQRHRVRRRLEPRYRPGVRSGSSHRPDDWPANLREPSHQTGLP